ncbi:unnamed protein product [Notodromas monacha]|uniref:Laminin N-terminal domain-containing protein n=1 Tax=Notodromas monacha TaxID=399045 RepID=A0A7R9BNP7_9CRUS|nr:unnamed protein product [Notodromas monacha]CAG0917492.1 unnamed protein product [Notodromas monacha]
MLELRRFGKSFRLVYIAVKFQSSRPDSFAIYKRVSRDSPWVPFHFFSASCRDNYGVDEKLTSLVVGSPRALCTSTYSDIVPLSGGDAVFGTLEGQPNKHKFEESDELQGSHYRNSLRWNLTGPVINFPSLFLPPFRNKEWVTATEIKITLDKMNTFRDEMYGKQSVLQSYFFAISDLTIGGRCRCNGHAPECIDGINEAGERALICDCQHNTEGDDCQRCKPFYQDAPWRRASALGSYPCQPKFRTTVFVLAIAE